MYILGLNAYAYDASAALIKDGKVIAAAAQERFDRKKHSQDFPYEAIQFCLQQAKISPTEIDHIAISNNPKLRNNKKIKHVLKYLPKSLGVFKNRTQKRKKTLEFHKQLKSLNPKAKIHFIDHHLTHVAGTYYPSPYKEAAIFSYDALGDFVCSMMGYGKQNKIKIHTLNYFPHSLGYVYSAVTQFLGFRPNNGEYKVMGLADLGKPIYASLFRKIMKYNNGKYTVDTSYFLYHVKGSAWTGKQPKLYSKKLSKALGKPRKPETEMLQRHADIAASLQLVFEEITCKLLNYLHKKSPSDNLVIGGGCALNCVVNGKITKKTPFKNIYIMPAAGDDGTSIGAALLVYHAKLKQTKRHEIDNVYFGPEYTEEEIKKAISQFPVKATKQKDICKTTAKLLTKKNVIGWFQGRMEFGPRALGNRSIIADPRPKEMQDILNKKVKHRESFRPFAPTILEENVQEYFETTEKKLPFMLFVHKAKKIKEIPTVVHGQKHTGRVQSINKKQNKKYYTLIKEFEKLTKCPVIVNTSFNIRGEPIVCTPQDAIRCFIGTGIDYLILGDYLVEKSI